MPGFLQTSQQALQGDRGHIVAGGLQCEHEWWLLACERAHLDMQNDDFMMLPVNNVLKDLQSNNELCVNLALSFAGSGAYLDTEQHTPSVQVRTLTSALADARTKLQSQRGVIATASTSTTPAAVKRNVLHALQWRGRRCQQPLHSQSLTCWCAACLPTYLSMCYPAFVSTCCQAC
jgi:hypothetical protein